MQNTISGALNPIGRDADNYAKEKYESIRKQSNDILYISRNTNFSYEQVSLIKGHIFYNKHILTRKYPDRFDKWLSLWNVFQEKMINIFRSMIF